MLEQSSNQFPGGEKCDGESPLGHLQLRHFTAETWWYCLWQHFHQPHNSRNEEPQSRLEGKALLLCEEVLDLIWQGCQLRFTLYFMLSHLKWDACVFPLHPLKQRTPTFNYKTIFFHILSRPYCCSSLLVIVPTCLYASCPNPHSHPYPSLPSLRQPSPSPQLCGAPELLAEFFSPVLERRHIPSPAQTHSH